MPSEFLFLNGPFQGYKSEGITPPPQKMNECSLKRDHFIFKRKLSSSNHQFFKGYLSIFRGLFNGKTTNLKMYLLLKMVLFHCHVRFQGVKKNRSKLTSRWPRVGQTSRCQVCLAFWSRGRWPVELGLGQVLVGRFNTTAGAPKDMGPPIAPYYSLIPNLIFQVRFFTGHESLAILEEWKNANIW